jgi:hypothetical protein
MLESLPLFEVFFPVHCMFVPCIYVNVKLPLSEIDNEKPGLLPGIYLIRNTSVKKNGGKKLLWTEFA